MSKPEKDPLEEFEEAFLEATKKIKRTAKEVGQDLNDLAFDLAIIRKKMWEDYQMSDRLAGATLTAKFGLLAGPLVKIGIPVAMAYGFIKGPQIVKKHNDWLKKGEQKRAEEQQASNDDEPGAKPPTP